MADQTDDKSELRHRTVQSSEDKKSSGNDDRVESAGQKKPAVRKNTKKRKPSTSG